MRGARAGADAESARSLVWGEGTRSTCDVDIEGWRVSFVEFRWRDTLGVSVTG